MNPEGRNLLDPQAKKQNSTSKPIVTEVWSANLVSILMYPDVTLSNQALNLLKKRSNNVLFALSGLCGFNNMAHRAGVRVRALIPEITILIAIVSENCL
ncbi:hypothetical protein D3C86_1075890 [compost metagenome]